MIVLENVSKYYKMGEGLIRALDGISLRINEGNFLAIMGPSGSGKSTLMNIIGCLDRPTSGVYLFEGEDITKKKERELAFLRNKKVGFVFQTFNLLPRFSCLKNVELPLFYAGYSKDEMRKKAYKALEAVYLSHRIDHKPSELSGGEMQRVAIARALVNDPKIICADEPTGNLDTKTGEEIMNIFYSLNNNGVTIILVTHEKKLISFAKRRIFLVDGRIVD
ncbi:TPA: macrolide ABC transporter ATP-binding protein [bacterium]|nr:macrolide ABC transporter ATP-binding protein [bacterium]